MALIEKMTKDIQQKGGLIVSCQPVDNSPMDKPDIVAAMAQAAVNAGAVAVRIEGIDNLKATRPLIDVPIIGIEKRDLPDSPVNEGMYCHQLGTEFIGSTMSGYTGGEIPKLPDLQLVTALAEQGCRVIAEGRYNSPMMAARGMQAGAWAVTVGSALTRLEHVCEWFTQALKWQQELDK